MKIEFKPNIKWIPYGRDSAYNRYFRCSCCGHEIMVEAECEIVLPKVCEKCGSHILVEKV